MIAQASRAHALRIALLCAAILCALDLLGLFNALDRKLLDERFRLRGRRPTSDRIALVTIDDATMVALDDRWPLPRKYPAVVIAAVGDGGASAIGFDQLFLGLDPCPELPDSLLVSSTRAWGRTVHA